MLLLVFAFFCLWMAALGSLVRQCRLRSLLSLISSKSLFSSKLLSLKATTTTVININYQNLIKKSKATCQLNSLWRNKKCKNSFFISISVMLHKIKTIFVDVYACNVCWHRLWVQRQNLSLDIGRRVNRNKTFNI